MGSLLFSNLSLAASSAVNTTDTSSREFIMSCTYGVLAGTLVGVALLAFTDQPGENLGKVARGASLGLYTGILLGLYVVYGVPNEDLKEPELYNSPRESWKMKPQPMRWALAPYMEKGSLVGAGIQAQLFTF